jgi:TolB-like protein/tetratricopeptide (TPR) repeat protein
VETSERRLVAILSADIVGYARLMAEDEEATVQSLRGDREQIELLLRQHRGRLVDFTGDNFLAEFSSVVEALRCAVQIQRALRARNADLRSGRRMLFRMGLHLGDVRVEGPQLFGDGVNVAARLEALAQPGGICVSGSVYEQVRSVAGLSFHDRGAQPLKNIPDPVRVYAVQWAEPAQLEPSAREPDRPAVAVLPFVNMSPDPDQEYFADGMAEEIINALAKVNGLRVISRTSAFAFKGTNADIATIGSRLNVSTVVEGSVRKAGDRLRITAQLVDVAGGHHLWSEVYDRPVQDVFEVQDEIARTIVRTIKPKLLGDPYKPLVSRATESRAAYELYLRAGDIIALQNPWDTRTAIAMLEGAVVDDREFAGAWARLAHGCCQMANHFEPEPRWHRRTDEALERALALDPANAEARVVEGRVLWSPRRGFRSREALLALEDALRLQPGSPAARTWHSLILLHVGLMAEAGEGLAEARAAEPGNPRVLTFIGQNLFFEGRIEEAQDQLSRAFAVDPTSFYTHLFQPCVHLYRDELVAAERALAKARGVLGEDAVLDASEALLWAKRGEPQRADEFLSQVSRDRPSLMHVHHVLHWAAAARAVLGRKEQAARTLREAAATGLPNYPAFRDDPHFAECRDAPEMKQLLSDLQSEWRSFRQEFGHAAEGS